MWLVDLFFFMSLGRREHDDCPTVIIYSGGLQSQISCRNRPTGGIVVSAATLRKDEYSDTTVEKGESKFFGGHLKRPFH